ncbi:hypothetical protein PI126_g5215 [Phytophthora idaei]|nr:hypothetical protein PI126_g5215 [Phytophthora idaei]
MLPLAALQAIEAATRAAVAEQRSTKTSGTAGKTKVAKALEVKAEEDETKPSVPAAATSWLMRREAHYLRMVVAHQVAIALFLRKTVINTRTKVTVAETVALEIEAEITQSKVAGMVDEEDGSATTDFKGEVLTPPWQRK